MPKGAEPKGAAMGAPYWLGMRCCMGTMLGGGWSMLVATAGVTDDAGTAETAPLVTASGPGRVGATSGSVSIGGGPVPGGAVVD